MNASHKHGDETPTPPDQSPVVLLLGTVADTTWRMFIPTIGLCLAGYAIDQAYATKPWFTLVGLAAGGAVSAVLVVRLLRRITQ